MDEVKQVTFRMDADIYAEFQKLCIDRRSSVKEELSRMITEEVAKKDKSI